MPLKVRGLPSSDSKTEMLICLTSSIRQGQLHEGSGARKMFQHKCCKCFPLPSPTWERIERDRDRAWVQQLEKQSTPNVVCRAFNKDRKIFVVLCFWLVLIASNLVVTLFMKVSFFLLKAKASMVIVSKMRILS